MLSVRISRGLRRLRFRWQVEEETGTFCFIAGTQGNEEQVPAAPWPPKPVNRLGPLPPPFPELRHMQLLIFSFDRASREKAEKTINSLVNERMSMDDK